MQRLRLRFGRGEEIRFISHLDIVRSWERAFRRAEIPVAYSQGHTPHPRIAVAAPLAVGVTSEAELMDVYLSRRMPPQALMMMVRSQLPPGFNVFDAWEVGLGIPSLQSCLAYAEYLSQAGLGRSEQWVRDAISSLLQTKELPWHHSRGSKVHYYDLRALIADLWFISRYERLCTLGMRLRCGAGGSGRPEQVVSALGFSKYPQSIHRTRLILEGELDT